VRQASVRRQQAHQAYIEAILAASVAGASLREIAEAAGVKHQTVAAILRRARP